jgi:hypothetical protein
MKMNHILLVTTAMIALGSPAFAADKETYESSTKIEKEKNGNFSEKSKTSKTLMDGTFNSFEKNVDIKVDSKGNIDKTITTEQVVDAKGMGNKHITKTKDTETRKDGKTSFTHEASVDGKKVTSDSNFEKDANGNYERKDTITRTDAAGTTRSTEKEETLKMGANGTMEKTTTVESSTDPKGLGNKTTETVTDTKKVTEDSITRTHEKQVDGEVVDKSTNTAETH